MTNSSASSHSSFVVLKDYHLFQKHSESSSWNKDSHLMLTLKIKDEHDGKYAIGLLTFCGGTGKSANNLVLGVLHLIDSIKTCGHPDPIGACCTYFPMCLSQRFLNNSLKSTIPLQLVHTLQKPLFSL